MAEAALQEEFTFPEGGIGDFYMEDDEIEALGRLEAEEAYGSSGIANFSDVAERMASYGRHGDDTVAHVETGELVIPKALIEDNPKLRDSIFEHLEELGVEDPERYVVGSGANSINPDTGLPEFFFKKIIRAVKKTVKKVTRAVKKVAKKVVKVVKKAAPVIIPIALNAMFPGLGAIYSGALGAGIGTLVQGGSLKDAMKNALIGGAIGGATAGISGGLKAAPGQTFSQGAVSGIKEAAKLSNLSTAGQQLASGQFGQSGLDKVLSDQATSVPTVSDTLAQAKDLQLASTELPPGFEVPTTDAPVGQSDAAKFLENQARAADAAGIATPVSDATIAEQLAAETASFKPGADTLTGSDPGILDSFKDCSTKAGDYLFRGGQTEEALARAASNAKTEAIRETLLELGHQGPLTTAPATIASEAIAAGKAAAAAAGPGFITKFGPSAALAGTAAYGLGAFSAPEQEDLGVEDVYTPIRTGPEYELPSETPRGATGPTVVDTRYGIDPRTYLPFNPFIRPQFRTQRVAEGGEIFPRRVGGIMPDEGVPGKDSVRAMLMPGEFVMTTDAVKGLGNGDNDQGIKNMYDMMRGLEAKGRSMA